MNLVYGSSSSSYMDCKVFFGDECLSFSRSGVRLDQCSCIGAFVVGLIIFGSYVYGSTTFRMSTVLDGYPSYSLYLVRVSIYILLFVARSACGGWRRLLLCMRTLACQYSTTLYFSFDHHPPPIASVGSPPTLPHAVMLRVIQSTVIVLILANFITMSVSCPSGLCLLPPFRWLTVRLG